MSPEPPFLPEQSETSSNSRVLPIGGTVEVGIVIADRVPEGHLLEHDEAGKSTRRSRKGVFSTVRMPSSWIMFQDLKLPRHSTRVRQNAEPLR